MKKYIILLIGCIIAVAAYAQVTKIVQNAEGLRIGVQSDKIGFWGATPVTQRVVSATVTADGTTLTNLLIELQRQGIIRTN